MRKLVVLFLLCLNCLFFTQIQAQLEVISIGDRKLSLEGVISQGRISDIVEDNEGLIWVGTLDGLNSYDGYNAVVYRNIEGDTTSLSNNIVNCLHVCCDKGIWVATNRGLNWLSTQTNKFEVFLESDPVLVRHHANQINKIDLDSERNVWMATAGAGIVKFDTKTKKRTYISLEKHGNEKLSQTIDELSVDLSDNVWFANRSGQVGRYNSRADTIEFFTLKGRRDNNASFSWVGEIFTDKNNKVWFALTGYYQGIYYFDDQSGVIVEDTAINDLICSNKKFHTSLYSIQSFFDGENGSLWFASVHFGIFHIESKTKAKVYVDRVPTGVDFNIYKNDLGTSVMYISSTGILWKGTNGCSLEYIPDLNSIFNTVKPDMLNSVTGPSSIRAFEEDEKYLYVGGYYSLMLYDKENDTYSTLKMLNTYYTLCKNPLNSDELIIGTEGGGVIFYNIKTKQLLDEFGKPYVRSIDGGNDVFELNAQGDSIVWIGRNTGVEKFLTKTRTFEKVRIEFPEDDSSFKISVTSSFIDEDGTVWFGTFSNGVWRYNSDEDIIKYMDIVVENHDLSPQRVNSILIDSEKNIWLCTDNGILTAKDWDQKFRKFTTSNGLSNSFVYAALEDDNGNIWFSTNKGLSMLDIDDLEFTNYLVNDGLQGNEFNTGAYFKDEKGRLYFGGIKGYTYFTPERNRNKNINYPFILNKVTSNLGEIQIEQSNDGEYLILLDKETTFLNIEFALLSFLNEKQNNYQYRNSELGPEWLDLNHQNKLLIDQPVSGKRIIEIRAKTDGDNWNERKLMITLIKSPYFWEFWYFKPIVVFVVLLIVFMYVDRRIRKSRKQNAILENQIAIRTNELKQAYTEVKASNASKDKLFSIIAHDLRNPLNSLMGFSSLLKDQRNNFSDEEQQDFINVIYSSANNLSNLMDNLLNWSRVQLNKIKPYFSDFAIKEALTSNLRFLDGHITQKKISVRILQFDDAKVYADVDMISVIIRNLLSNAIKYCNEGGTITIRGKVQENNIFAFFISDDGIGMDKPSLDSLFTLNSGKSKKGTNKEPGSGLGLILCQEFANLNNCTIAATSEKGKGSSFTIFIPLSKQ